MLSLFFHRWERRLADVSKDRIVRPFEWGLDWLPAGHRRPPRRAARARAGVRGRRARATRSTWLTPPATTDYEVGPRRPTARSLVRFPSALTTPHPENNRRHDAVLPRRRRATARRRAVLVLPQWNADEGGHVGLCRLLARFGMSALRLSLPYHDTRMPPELTRADYIVSANIVRTLEVCRQAVLDARRAIAWLASQGYDRIGILGTSLGSCLSMLTALPRAAHPRAGAEPHLARTSAMSCGAGCRRGTCGRGSTARCPLDDLRALWLPISPQVHLDTLQARDVSTLLVYARYDLTFPVDLSRDLVNEFRARGIPHQVSVLPCGHYSTGVAPFKFMDGAVLTRFLHASL